MATSDTYLNLFGYHLLESVPGLKINQTLRIDDPFAGERPFELGLMILVFKFAVLIPTVRWIPVGLPHDGTVPNKVRGYSISSTRSRRPWARAVPGKDTPSSRANSSAGDKLLAKTAARCR